MSMLGAADLHLPAMYCPIPSAVHPAARQIDSISVDWLRQWGLCRDQHAEEKLATVDCGDIVARLFPAGRTEALAAITKFYYWGNALDDIVEKVALHDLAAPLLSHGRVQRALDIGFDKWCADDVFVPALREIYDAFAALSSPVIVNRLKELNRAFALAVAWESSYRNARTIPTLDDFIAIRMHTAGGGLYGTGLVQVAGTFEVSREELDDPQVKMLTEIAWVILSWDNDIYSYWYEVERGLDNVNLVTVLAQKYRTSPPQALALAIRLRNQIMKRYLEVRNWIADTAGESLSRYLQGFDHLIRGNIDWGVLRTSRYLVAGDGREALTIQTDPMTKADITLDADPSAIDSISWWWTEPNYSDRSGQ